MGECILIRRKCLVGMILGGGMHPDLQEMFCRDDFGAVECILICRKCFAGMILGGEMHPDLQEMSWRDDFQQENAS